MVKIEKILFPTELREYSLKILPFVISMSEKYNSTIYLLHVIEDLSKWGGFYIPHISLDIYQKEAMETAEKLMDRACRDQMQGCPDFQRINPYKLKYRLRHIVFVGGHLGKHFLDSLGSQFSGCLSNHHRHLCHPGWSKHWRGGPQPLDSSPQGRFS